MVSGGRRRLSGGLLWGALALTALFGVGVVLAGYILHTSRRAHKVALPPTVGNFPSVRRRLPPQPAAADTYRFAVVGDTRGVGTYEEIMSLLRDEPLAFMVNLGDFAGDPNPAEHAFFRLEMATEMLTPYPVFLVVGNHDVSGEGFTLADFERHYGPTQFAFRYGPDLFVVLRYVRGWPTASAVAFLREVLRRERASSRYVFLFTHTPLVDLPAWKSAQPTKPDPIVRLLEKYRVTYAFAGDLHCYRRVERGGVRYIITGGGGAHLERRERFGRFHHAVVVQVGAQGISEDLLRVPKMLALEDRLERWAVVYAGPWFERHAYPVVGLGVAWLLLVVAAWYRLLLGRGVRPPGAAPHRSAFTWFALLVVGGAAAAFASLVDVPSSRLAASLHNTLPDHLCQAVSDAGRVELPAAVLGAILVAGLACSGRTRERFHLAILRGVLALALGAAVANAGKAIVGRPRPKFEDTPTGPVVAQRSGSGNAMPSGHTLAAFALAGAVAEGVGPWRWVLYALAGLVGLSRVVVGAHWMSDVVVGAMVGLAVGWFCGGVPRFTVSPFRRWLADHPRVAACLFVSLLALLLFILGSKGTPLIDRDEPRFAQTAREMLRRGDFVVPHLNGRIRFNKPPLAYWAMAGVYTLFGADTLTARLPSALFGLGTILLTFAVGRRLFDPWVGMLGSILLLTSPQMVVESRAATADAALTMLVVLAFYALVRLRQMGRGEGRTWLWVFVLYTSLGLSNLAKGPGGLAVVALTLIAFLLLTRERALLRRLHLPWGLLIIAVVNLPWMVLVQLRTGGEFLRRIVQDHLLAHTLRGKEGHGAIFLVYIPFLVVFFFPWSVFLPRAVGRLWRGRGDWRLLFLLLWAGLGFLLFCFVRTKLPHYLLPIYPALSLMVSWSVLKDQREGRGALFGRLGRAGAYSLVASAVGLAVGLPVVAAASGFPPMVAVYAAAAGVFLVVGAVWGAVLMRRGPSPAGPAALVVGVWLWLMGFFHLTLPEAARYSLSRPAAKLLLAQRARGCTIATVGYQEPSLVWLTNGIEVVRSVDDLLELAAPHRRLVCLVRRKEYKILSRDSRLRFKLLRNERGPVWLRGFNFAKWRWEVACVARVRRLRREPPGPRGVVAVRRGVAAGATRG